MKMKRLLASLALAWVSACAPSDGSTDFDAYGAFLDSLMHEAGVPELGFAVFDDAGLVYEHVGGLKDKTSLEPIDSRTAFEAASISKGAAA